MLKKLSTSHRYCLASKVSARGKIISFLCAACCRNRVTCVVNVMSGRYSRCLKKNLKCSLVVTQGDCKQSHKISYFPC